MRKHMYKIIAAVVALSLILFIYVDNTRQVYSFGVGIVGEFGSIVGATEEKDGSGQALVTIAAVLVNQHNEIIDCKIDCADSTVGFKVDGTAVEASKHQTKRELGEEYNMVEYGGAQAEWYKQVDSFQQFIKGKKLDELNEFVSENGKGTQEVIDAGCTIVISGFVRAVEQACARATPTEAVLGNEIQLGVVTTQSNANSTEQSNGSIDVLTTVVAVALDKDNKVKDAFADAIEFEFQFDSEGENRTQIGEVISKHQRGDDFNMVENGGAVAEWFEQANSFSETLIGKDAAQITELVADNGKGSQEVVDAGCTIYVSDFVKAAVKATQVKTDN